MTILTQSGRVLRGGAAVATLAVAVGIPAAAVPAYAKAAPVPPLVFSVSDGESPEGYSFTDPTCPPDITCKPQRVAGRITFEVRSNVSLAGQPITVRYTTVNGSAVAPGDYTARSGTLTFAPGDFSETVTVTMNINPGGTEPTENFFLQLSQPSVAGDTSDRGEGKILDGIEVVY